MTGEVSHCQGLRLDKPDARSVEPCRDRKGGAVVRLIVDTYLAPNKTFPRCES